MQQRVTKRCKPWDFLSMTAERHNRPQQILHAEQAEKAGECTSSAHSGLPWRRLGRFFATTMLATVGDVEIILGIYLAGALAAGDLAWGLRGRWNIYATGAVMGLAYAALVEHAALTAGRWSYSERMPVVSVLGAGLWPLLQMTLLPPLTFLFARWWTCRSATRGFL
jgi:hypothetical protein